MQEVCSLPPVIPLITIPAFPAAGPAQSPGQLRVATAVLCRHVVDREPVDAGAEFPLSTGKLSCFTTVTGVEGSSKITHIRYPGDQERFRSDLAVSNPTGGASAPRRSDPVMRAPGAWTFSVLPPGF